jgi:hemoglobin/transferrin/lactoferrin receptor protein
MGIAWVGPLQAGDAALVVPLDEVVVTATRTERRVDDTPGTVTAFDLVGLDGASLSELARGETLISVPFAFSGAGTAYGRGGATSINIRGVEGNRVLLQVDGVRVPDEFRLGGNEAVGRDYFDLELYRRVEILQGSASALYGSDALGGVVTFTTKSPEDYAFTSDRPYELTAKAGYRSVDDSWHAAGTAVAHAGRVSALVVYSRREGTEPDNNGAVAPNPERFASDAVLTKLVWKPALTHRLEVSLEYFDREVVADADNRETTTGTATTVENTIASATERFRLGANWLFAPGEGTLGAFDLLDVRAYLQDAVARDVAHELIEYSPPSPANGAFRDRLITTAFNNDTAGFSAAAVKRLGTDHRLAYGLEASITETNKPWSSIVSNSRGVSHPMEPRMAETDTTRVGLYLQDEAEFTLGGRRLTLIPGVRLDQFRLSPDNSAAYLAVTAGQPAPAFDEVAITPKIGAVLELTPTLNGYAQYNQGFRYPTAEDLTATFTNPITRYRTIPNPELREETSDAYEIGLKGHPFPGLTVRAAAFYTAYDDFIEQISFAPLALQDFANWPAGTFQTQNRQDARIYGGELWARARLGDYWPELSGWSVTASVGHSKGTYTEQGGVRTRLVSVEPLKATATLAYDSRHGRFGGRLAVESTQGGRPGAATQYYAPGYTVFDLVGYWRAHERLTFHVGLYNLTDEKYWRYASVRGVATTSVHEQERRTQPGFHSSLFANLTF